MLTRTIVARNNAADSDNKIHDDAEARRYGYSGGLVPGRDVYAYMCHLPVARWGEPWLAGGAITVALHKPVYDGDLLTIIGADDDDEMTIELHDSRGSLCATAHARPHRSGTQLPDPLHAEVDRVVPGLPPAASPVSLAPGTVFGTRVQVFTASDGQDHLTEVSETLSIFAERGIAHPGWILKQANRALMDNVALGPWIHVSSDVSHRGLITDGDEVSTRITVTDEYERSGHRYCRLAVRCAVDTRPIAVIDHLVIYQPRRPT